MITSHLLKRHEIDSQAWDDFVNASPQYSLYVLTGYLDCVCEGWNAIIVAEHEEWLAIMPLNVGRKYFQFYSLKPSWVQYLGILFKSFNIKIYQSLYLKKKIVEEIINCLPDALRLFNHNFSPAFDYFAPFYWNNFNVKPFQTYCLSMNKTLAEIYADFSKSVSEKIAKAEKSGLQVLENNNISPLVKMMLERKIITCEDGDKIEKLWVYLSAKNSCFNIYITDPKSEKIYCGGAFIVERERVIFKASALDYTFKNTGANNLLIWKGIQKTKGMDNIKP